MKKKLIFNYPNLYLAILTIISAWLILYFFQKNLFNMDFFAAIALLGLSWLLVFLDKILKLKIPDFLYLIYYAFLSVTLLFGTLFNFYHFIPRYHEFTQFLGGVILTIVGIYIIVKLDNIGYLKFSVVITYAVFFVGFATATWEVILQVIDAIFSFYKQNSIFANNYVMTMIGAISSAILLIIDNIFYHNKYLEKIINRF